jgi:ArsR family transcriptional regulator
MHRKEEMIATPTELQIADVECCSVLEAPIDELQAAEVARGFAALADPVRLRLFSLIAAAGTVCSCDLIKPIGKSQPTVSHHTKVLSEAGLITGEKIGRWVHWSVVPERIAEIRAALAPAGTGGR